MEMNQLQSKSSCTDEQRKRKLKNKLNKVGELSGQDGGDRKLEDLGMYMTQKIAHHRPWCLLLC